MLKLPLGITLLFGCLPLIALAQSGCPAVSCDCQSIPDPDWRSQCQSFERQMSSSCDQNQSLNAYCQVAGPGADSLALVVSKIRPQAVNDPAATQQKVSLLSWAVREEHSAAVLQQDQGDWAEALARRKRESDARQQLYQASVNLLDYYQIHGELEEWEAQLSAMIDLHSQDARRDAELADNLWRQLQEAQAAGQPADRARLLLAQRILRNAGDSMAMAAESARQSEQLGRASQLWQESARLSSQLLEWKREGGSSDKVISFYRQRAAARWYQSGLMALISNDAEAARLAKQRSDMLWLSQN